MDKNFGVIKKNSKQQIHISSGRIGQYHNCLILKTESPDQNIKDHNLWIKPDDIDTLISKIDTCYRYIQSTNLPNGYKESKIGSIKVNNIWTIDVIAKTEYIHWSLGITLRSSNLKTSRYIQVPRNHIEKFIDIIDDYKTYLSTDECPHPYEIYIIELDKKVILEPEFCNKNPKYADHLPCYYIGVDVKIPRNNYNDHPDSLVKKYGISTKREIKEAPLTTHPSFSSARLRINQITTQLRSKGYGVI